MKIKSTTDLHLEAETLLYMVDKQERGELSEAELLKHWKEFRKAADAYLKDLAKEIKLN